MHTSAAWRSSSSESVEKLGVGGDDGVGVESIALHLGLKTLYSMCRVMFPS
jgi:hypothetical protein